MVGVRAGVENSPIGPMLLAVVFAPVAVYAADFVLVERSVRKQMQLLRQWLVQHRRYELREDPDDIARNLDLLQELQIQLGSLYELHETLLDATRDAIAIFDADGKLILQNRIFAGIFRSHQQLTSMDELEAEIQWIEEEARVKERNAVESEAYVGNETVFDASCSPSADDAIAKRRHDLDAYQPESSR